MQDVPGTSRYMQIANEIEEQIRSGILHEGDTLPSISHCAEGAGVSRSTIKRAYDRLCDLGLVMSEQGKAYHVVVQEQPDTLDSNDLRVFWSYAHKDDERCNGGITMLRKRIQEEYAFTTGSEASIFQDTKDISWGMDWRKELSMSLGVMTFFIPILTPTYLRSPNCLAELRTAVSRFESIGFPEGIYPIEFVDCSRAINQMNDDALANLLSDRHRLRNWIHLRFEDPRSSEYGKGVHQIVEAMIEKEDLWHARIENATSQNNNQEDGEGLLDRIAAIQVSVEQFEVITTLLAEDIREITNVFGNSSLPTGSTPKAALTFATILAKKLELPSKNLESHCKEFSRSMEGVDQGIDGIIEFHQLIKETGGTADTSMMDDVHTQMTDLLESIEEPFTLLESMRELISQFSRLSKAVRIPCKRIDAALAEIASSKSIIEGWEIKLREVTCEY